MSNVNVTSRAIQKILKKYNPAQAIAEYIWNGFDAKANTVQISYEPDVLGTLNYLKISDNGYGINFDELPRKFQPFYESEKTIEITAPVHTSAMHGKNGVGRLTFFTFAGRAEWETTFKSPDGLRSGLIKMSVERLNFYDPIPLAVPIAEQTGTTVTFHETDMGEKEFEESVIPFLVNEFCWFLELNRSKNYRIYINGVPLAYEQNIAVRETFQLKEEKSETLFDVNFVQWREPLHKELSKYYFQNDQEQEVYKDFTTLNKKADDFFHSVYIKSPIFDSFNFKSGENDLQTPLFGKNKSSPEYKYLIKELNLYLFSRRKPYLRTFGEKMVQRFDEEGILPDYQNEWEAKYRKPELTETLVSLYEVEPKLFTSLNASQKKTFVRLLDLLLDSGEREQVFDILDGIIELQPEERIDLAKLFKTTRLNRIIATIRLIEDRFRVYYQLRDLVFNPDLKANEVNHLQKAIESHYWIFGEQYHLVTAAEIKFDEALRRYVHLLTEQDTAPNIDHPDKLKEMDIFACRQHILTDRIENIVVELKHPAITLGKEQYLQVDQYLDVILKQPEFNANNMHWEFYLIGNKFSSTGFIQRHIITNKNHGIPSLALSLHDGRVKVYVKTWSELFADFEMKHKHLNDRLQLERELLVNELTAPTEIIIDLRNSQAAL